MGRHTNGSNFWNVCINCRDHNDLSIPITNDRTFSDCFFIGVVACKIVTSSELF